LIPLPEVAGGGFCERFASRGLKLQFFLPDKINLFGGRDRLIEVFNNLLGNNPRYTYSGGGLKIPFLINIRCCRRSHKRCAMW
ncbi:hypothetical protein Q2405_27150, partial [Escherichia coli]|nr:hypothetical protein [Escherichia coli]